MIKKFLKEKIGRIASTLALIGTLYYVGSYAQTAPLEDEAKELLPTIITAQEKSLGIRHQGTPIIKIKTIDPKNKDFRGEYMPREDTIYLPNLNEQERKFSRSIIKEVVNHELGHRYPNKLNEQRGKGQWPRQSDYDKDLGTFLIAEGIAAYFQLSMDNYPIDKFPDSKWPTNLAGYYDPLVFNMGGASLVEPIIKQYGDRGLLYLIDNTPKTNDLLNVQRIKAYQQKILKNLATNK